MRTSRRQFVSRSAVGSLGLIATPLLPFAAARAGAVTPSLDAKPVGEPIVASMSRYYRFSPFDGSRSETAAWIQIDLGIPRAINAIRLHPLDNHVISECDFPVGFRIECSDEPVFDTRMPVVSWHAKNYTAPGNFIARFPEAPVTAQYLRLDAAPLPVASNPVSRSVSRDGGAENAARALGLARIEILSGSIVVTVIVRGAANLRCPFGHASA